MDIASNAKYTCIKPECFYNTSRLTIALIIPISTIVLNVHHIAQRKAYFEDECNWYQALKVGWHCEQECYPHNYRGQEIE